MAILVLATLSAIHDTRGLYESAPNKHINGLTEFSVRPQHTNLMEIDQVVLAILNMVFLIFIASHLNKGYNFWSHASLCSRRRKIEKKR